MSKQFRNAYIIEKGKLNDMSALEPYVSEITYILSGDERDKEIAQAFRDNFTSFNPDLDVIIPTGRVISSFVLGYLMGFIPTFYIGIYRDKNYSFVMIYNQNNFIRTSNDAI